jgi:effector-binding domain-containing protein
LERSSFVSNFDALESTEVEVPPTLAAQMPGQSPADPPAIAAAMDQTFGRLMAFIGRHALRPAGPPRTIYTAYGPAGIKFTVALPVAAPPATPIESGPGSVGSLAGGKALRFTHRGPYASLAATYGQITEFLKAKGLMRSEADWAQYMPMWEEYLNDPQTTPEAELLTYIYLPVP